MIFKHDETKSKITEKVKSIVDATEGTHADLTIWVPLHYSLRIKVIDKTVDFMVALEAFLRRKGNR
jgi:hypothetical protein